MVFAANAEAHNDMKTATRIIVVEKEIGLREALENTGMEGINIIIEPRTRITRW